RQHFAGKSAPTYIASECAPAIPSAVNGPAKVWCLVHAPSSRAAATVAAMSMGQNAILASANIPRSDRLAGIVLSMSIPCRRRVSLEAIGRFGEFRQIEAGQPPRLNLRADSARRRAGQ